MIRDWLARSRANLLVWQHHLSPPLIEVVADRVYARTDVYTPNLYRDAQGEVPQVGAEVEQDGTKFRVTKVARVRWSRRGT